MLPHLEFVEFRVAPEPTRIPDGLEYGVIATKDGRSVEVGIVVQLRAPACLGSCVVLSPYSPREASPKFRKYPFLQDVF